MSFPARLGEVRFGLVLSDAQLLDQTGTPKGPTVSAGSRVKVLDAGPWSDARTGFRRLYRVLLGPGTTEGWIDGSSLALVTDEKGPLSVGVVPRRITIGGGEAEYNLLAVADAGTVTLIDTSAFPFPDEFHPSGVLRAAISDASGDGRPEVVVQAETIVSLRYLGATPLVWVAWLRPGDGTWAPILQYNESFATDAGYSYSASMRAYDSTGSGMLDMVRVDTEYVLISGESEFRSNTVSFYPWSGSSYRKAVLDELPRRGTVTTDGAALRRQPGADAAVEQKLTRGDALFVFDRSDTRASADNSSPWWYRAVTRSGLVGWISGADLELTWLDPLTENRAVFLGLAKAP
jgi:hypothetical protein